MLTLYSLGWSHYVEKVWWALDYKHLDWQRVEINAFTKTQIKQLGISRPLVPTLYDDRTHTTVTDSTHILKYLEDAYLQAPALFPADPLLRADVKAFMLWLDSTLGLWARRLGYAEVIRRTPQTLAQLFLARIGGGVLTRPIVRSISGFVVALMLIQRFRMHRNFRDGLYHKVETVLDQLKQMLGANDRFFGKVLTAADITVASFLRPLRVVPYFVQHPRFRDLFAWQERLFHEYRRPEYLYETVLKSHGVVKETKDLPSLPNVDFSGTLFKDWRGDRADNDQQNIRRLALPLYAVEYFKIRYFSRW